MNIERKIEGDEIRFVLTTTKTEVVWNFTKEQLLEEIVRLEVLLKEKKDLLILCEQQDSSVNS